MLKRFYTYVLISVLFAFTQIGMAAHEISHLNDLSNQSQSDHQHTGGEPCTLCLGLSVIAGGMPPTAFICPVIACDKPHYILTSSTAVQSFTKVYAARAPPSFSQL
ncbi:hypothetical protein [Methylophilus sp. Leaf408]|uniref:hypothetical protein n=1 Tax=Methylophilus sp. Leaf408 TaxID=2876561 RepID=UPI001E6247F1|nr:hypothetical protein [Methylophilus sp. Leaf408]